MLFLGTALCKHFAHVQANLVSEQNAAGLAKERGVLPLLSLPFPPSPSRLTHFVLVTLD